MLKGVEVGIVGVGQGSRREGEIGIDRSGSWEGGMVEEEGGMRGRIFVSVGGE